MKITESQIEDLAIELLEKQGYNYIYAPDIVPDASAGSAARMDKNSDVIFCDSTSIAGLEMVGNINILSGSVRRKKSTEG